MMPLKIHMLPDWFESVAAVMADKADKLCEMDSKMGDGDLGLTMRKGFGALPQILRELDEPKMGKKLIKAGMKMATVVPSTMGTLMASGIMNGGKALADAQTLDAAAYLTYLKGFADGIAKRGKCSRGDRTVLDAVAAAADQLEAALKENPDMTLKTAGELAAAGAAIGVEATKTMEPKYGKAAVHKAAAAGVADQGACAGLYMVQGNRDYFQTLE